MKAKHDYHFEDGYVSSEYLKAAESTKRKLIKVSEAAKHDNESRMLSSMHEARNLLGCSNDMQPYSIGYEEPAKKVRNEKLSESIRASWVRRRAQPVPA